MQWSMCQVFQQPNRSNLISWVRSVKVASRSSVSFFMCPLFSIWHFSLLQITLRGWAFSVLPSIKQMDDRVLIEAVLLPAFPLTPPTVNGHKLHLCLCEKQRNKSWTVNFQTTEMVWCVFHCQGQQSDKYKLIFYELYSLFLLSFQVDMHVSKPSSRCLLLSAVMFSVMETALQSVCRVVRCSVPVWPAS